jgi:hypothetical protein
MYVKYGGVDNKTADLGWSVQDPTSLASKVWSTATYILLKINTKLAADAGGGWTGL